MASSKEFKQAVREGRLDDAFVIAMGNAPELHITTWIASANESKNSQPRSGECLRTHVNLVEGEIVNEIGEQLIGDNLYNNLQKFHLQQVTQGHQTISQNLQSLQQMFRLLAILQKQQNGEDYSPVDTWKIAKTSNSLSPVSNTNSNSNLGLKPTGFALSSKTEDLSLVREEEKDLIDDLLSLDELDIELEEPKERQDTQQPEIKTEDWGDWLNEDDNESDINREMLDLDALDLDDSEDWQEDWGDETEFIPNSTVNDKDRDKE